MVPLHAHYAIQIAFGLERGIRFRTSEREEWKAYGGAMIPSRQPHAMDATGVRQNAVLFVEPETREGRVLAERHLAGGVTDMPPEALALTGDVFGAWYTGDKDALKRVCWNVVRALTGGAEPSVPSDERVLRAIAYINANLDRKLRLEDIASAAYLSPGRFRHVFVDETGMTLRPYILWRRFLLVWDLAMQGRSMSEAAHAAGFADAAHLSRTSKRLFGFPPTALSFKPRDRAT